MKRERKKKIKCERKRKNIKGKLKQKGKRDKIKGKMGAGGVNIDLLREGEKYHRGIWTNM
jgi:hypothetical protein